MSYISSVSSVFSFLRVGVDAYIDPPNYIKIKRGDVGITPYKQTI